MKALKLALAFLFNLVVIVGAFYIADGFGSDPLPTPPPSRLNKYMAEIEGNWTKAGDWDKHTFETNCERLDQLGVDYDVERLRDYNTALAIENVHRGIFAEWSSPQCSKEKVDAYHTAVGVIEAADADAAHNNSVKQVKRVYGVYANAYAVAHRGIGLQPRFDGDRWRSYDNYSRSMTAECNAVLADTTYKHYLSGINDINDNLKAYPSKLNAGRKRFYTALSGEIIDYFDDTPDTLRTRDDLKRLRTIKTKYDRENTYGDVRLASFVTEYNEDVEANERKNETDC